MDLEGSDRQPRAEIAKRIKGRRKELGLTQEALAQRAEVSKSFVSELEGGESAANGLVYLRIAKALDVSIQWLLTGELPEERVNPLSRVPIVSELADEMGWTHTKALDVAQALSRIVARRTRPGHRWEPTREQVLKLAEVISDDADAG
jgi:transcriptional regulator with XRE-family HTH domain